MWLQRTLSFVITFTQPDNYVCTGILFVARNNTWKHHFCSKQKKKSPWNSLRLLLILPNDLVLSSTRRHFCLWPLLIFLEAKHKYKMWMILFTHGWEFTERESSSAKDQTFAMKQCILSHSLFLYFQVKETFLSLNHLNQFWVIESLFLVISTNITSSSLSKVYSLKQLN